MAYKSDSQFVRPEEGFRFDFGGMKVNATPDACPPTKYPLAVNVRSYQKGQVQTRPGLVQLSDTDGSAITDIASYTQLNTDNLPRYLYRAQNNKIWLSQPPSETNVGTLAGTPNLSGASLLPFRPAQSPTPWIYAANGSDYQKFSAPAPITDAVTQQNVGIKEPQPAPDAGVQSSFIVIKQALNNSYTNAGTANSGVTSTRINDTVAYARQDPAFPTLWSLAVSSSVQYQQKQFVTINSNPNCVEDVFQPFSTPIAIKAIAYFNPTLNSGHCVIVPDNMSAGAGVDNESVYVDNALAQLRRGSLIQFSTNEVCYVWSVSVGPDGTVSFETSTVSTHTTAETIQGLSAIQVVSSVTIIGGQTIFAQNFGFQVTTGIGTQTSGSPTSNPFINASGEAVQPDDFILFPIYVDNMQFLNEVKLLFDVGDGSFTENYYYYTIRASDITLALNNTLSQLGAAQLVAQRQQIDAEEALGWNEVLSTRSGSQTIPGYFQYTQFMIPISEFTRVGSDKSKSLINVNSWQILVNTAGTVGVLVGEICTCGTFQADVGTSGSPYLYRIRPRSSLTGVKGNPSPATRYGVNPRRQQVIVNLLSAAYDPQIDTWDIFRYGGTVTSWRKIGQAPATATTFEDNYSDDAALAGELLEEDNLQPWPTVYTPFNFSTLFACGTILAISTSGQGADQNIARLLPGNVIQVGSNNVYTLRNRPVQIFSGGSPLYWEFDLIENAGAVAGSPTTPALIYEPLLAQQFLPYMWGPDASGTVFGVGDTNNPGKFYTTKPYAIDAAPDAYNQELTSPSEPLLGGEIVNGLSYVGTPDRWWALYPQLDNPNERYNPVEQPIPRGLAAPFGHCSDGKALYWWAKDGIWSSSKGSLTDADLYTLFPHDGVPGQSYTYQGNIVSAPNYAAAAAFRLCYANGYLYATYIGMDSSYHTLVLHVDTGAWAYDFPNVTLQPTVYYMPPQPEGQLSNVSIGTPYATLVAGGVGGQLMQETPNTGDLGNPISGLIATFEYDGGDVRAGEQWGDTWLDCVPTSPTGMTVTPSAFGVAAALSVPVPQSSTRIQTPISVGGQLTRDFLGLFLAWSDSYTSGQTSPTLINIWQPSYVLKPEMTQDRFTDWFDGGTEQAKYIQGFLLHADTFNQPKSILIRDSDNLGAHPFAPAPIQLNGESIKAYSFNTPFIAHQIRIEPQDQVSWRVFDFDIVFEPTPELGQTWQTQGTAFGLTGYMHIRQVSPCYAATEPITLSITSYDGQSPAAITLPSTGGAMQKFTQMLTANKGSLYFFSATSSAPFQLFLDNWEIMVGKWARQDNYLRYRSLGGPTGDNARV